MRNPENDGKKQQKRERELSFGNIVYQLKYNHSLSDERKLELIDEAVAEIKRRGAVEELTRGATNMLVVPVPSAKERTIQHVYEIAKRLAGPQSLYFEALIKTTPIESKTLETGGEYNPGDFRCDYQLEGYSILLIDDTYGEGATLRACIRTLKEKGADAIYFLSLCKNTRGGMKRSQYQMAHNNRTRPNFSWFDLDLFWFTALMADNITSRDLKSIHRRLSEESIDPEQVTLEKIYELFPELEDKLRDVDLDKLYDQYEALRREGVIIVHPFRKDVPKLFDSNPHLPPVLLCKGNIGLLSAPSVAVIGSRKASQLGLEAAREIAGALAKEGINVVSGYAKGVDTEAHLGALESEGTTTIVLSYGISQFKLKRAFPKTRLDQDMLVVSQFPPDDPWAVWRAMERNKVILALSKCVVVIECDPKREKNNKDGDGNKKKGGTYAAVETASTMNKKLFVLSHKYFGKEAPAGNVKLLEEHPSQLDIAGNVTRRIAIDNPSDISEIVKEAKAQEGPGEDSQQSPSS